MSRTFIGVDVSSETLEVHVRPANSRRRFPNTPTGIVELVAFAKQHSPERIIFESTGPYQKAAVAAMLAQELPAVVVNARQVRDFAKGMGKLAETDAVDAAVIAHFGEIVPTEVRPLGSEEHRELCELYDRRGQLVQMPAVEKNHRHAAAGGSPEVTENINTVIAFLESQIHGFEKRMDTIIESSAAFQARDTILRSITGIGPQVSRTLIAYLPELGHRSRQSIAALVGLAPFNDDSGRHTGQRHIRGGRSKVRTGLYQAAVVAVRHAPPMKAFYASLKAKGKASKVALVAVARKILVLANALIRDDTTYKPSANPVC